MQQLGIPAGLHRFYIKTTINPATRLGGADFYQYATPEQRERLIQLTVLAGVGGSFLLWLRFSGCIARFWQRVRGEMKLSELLYRFLGLSRFSTRAR